MISQETIRELTKHNLTYILGARLRAVKEIREQVLSRAGRYSQVRGPREKSHDPAPSESQRGVCGGPTIYRLS